MGERACFSGKTYYAQRFSYGTRIDVYGNGFTYPLRTDDFDWGCSNRYSLNLSRTILTDFVGEEISDTCAEDFNRDFISCMPTAGFSLPGEAIVEWLRDKQLGSAMEITDQSFLKTLGKEA